MRHRFKTRPARVRDGQEAFRIPQAHVRKRSEIAATLLLMAHRRLFGLVYCGLQPDYFFHMPPRSGVFVTAAVPTRAVCPSARFPGDIDLLVVPYEDEDLVLDRILAIEVKVTRATFRAQGKSPNDFGVSQASALLKLGFPYVGLLHLISSDVSPRDAWRPMGLARILDSSGRAKLLPDKEVDCMPIDLMARAFGRLQAACQTSKMGRAAVFLDWPSSGQTQPSFWHPGTHGAERNDIIDKDVVRNVAKLFDIYPERFLDNPRSA